MSNMICGQCGRPGIKWVGPMSRLSHTECPHCGGKNCHREAEQLDVCRGCGSEVCNGECQGDDSMGASA